MLKYIEHKIYHVNHFLKGFIYLFFREWKGGRKRGRETSMCSCFSCTPHWGPGLQPRRVPWLGIEPETLWVTACDKSTELHQPGFILTIFKCTAQWHEAHSPCSATITIIRLQNFLVSLNWNSISIKHKLPNPSSPQSLATTLLPSVSINLTTISRIPKYLSFYDWLISLSIMSSGFIHVVAGVRMSFLFQAE